MNNSTNLQQSFQPITFLSTRPDDASDADANFVDQSGTRATGSVRARCWGTKD